jgi:hypothetical protein
VSVGGRARPVSDEGPIQQLILTSEGKLVVQDSRTDMESAERKTRYDNWKEEQKAVQETVDTIKNGGKKPDRIQLDSGGK